ncbi:unnamed protein product, partial [Meganyctiphanes norvegica]
MDSRLCPTCSEEYDNEDHRVRMLQCGHSQCTSCMQAQFTNHSIRCPSCRATHTFPNLDSIPINYIAENMKEEIDKLKNQNTLFLERDAAPLAPKLHKGICEEHDAIKVFRCNTHHEWLCSHCTVTEHPRGDCDVIPIRKQFEKDKVLTKSKIAKILKNIDDTKSDITFSIGEVDEQK